MAEAEVFDYRKQVVILSLDLDEALNLASALEFGSRQNPDNYGPDEQLIAGDVASLLYSVLNEMDGYEPL